MTDNTARRRGHGEDAIYFDAAKNRYVGAISVGFGPDGKPIRRKVSGRTKAEVRDKLKAAHNELDRGLHTSATYTVRQAVDDWLEGGLPGRSERTRSIYREALKPLLEHIALKPLRELTARDVRRGGRQPHGPDRAAEPVVYLGAVPRAARGGAGVPAERLRGAEPGCRHPYRGGQGTALGSRRPRRRSQRGAACAPVGGGLALSTAGWRHQDGQVPANPSAAPSGRSALREHRKRQAEDRLAAGALWQDHDLVFASIIGTPLDAANVRREFRKITEAAGLGTDWAPRDLRHTFVSLMSADGVPIEEIARLAGHNRTATTELVYRHELRPVITTGAEVMDRILNLRG